MIAQFALRLIFGMSTMWCLMPRSQVSSGFFRIQMLVSLGLAVLAAMSFGQLTGTTAGWTQLGPYACAGIAALAFVGSILWTLERRRPAAIVGALISLSSAAVLFGSFVRPESSDIQMEVLGVLSEASSAMMLGSAVTGMLLGHWYLTATSMSIEPLSRINNYLGIATLVRLVVASIGLAMVWGQLAGSTAWIWLTLRWSAGIIGPLIVVLMVRRILRYRNTQSATGVLFAGVVLVFIGEMTALLLYRELPIPM